MSYMDWDSPSWRDDIGLKFHIIYKKKWAYRPIICSAGEKVWFKNYYSVYRVWSSDIYDDENSHIDFLENITEADYIVRKLAENH
jgi:hypothetical protein